jgi:hypothetical protein
MGPRFHFVQNLKFILAGIPGGTTMIFVSQHDMIHFAAKLDELVAASRRSYPWFFSSSRGFAIAL